MRPCLLRVETTQKEDGGEQKHLDQQTLTEYSTGQNTEYRVQYRTEYRIHPVEYSIGQSTEYIRYCTL